MDQYANLQLLCGTLWSFRKECYLCDTTIVTGDKELSAHSIVLAAGSAAFRDALKTPSCDDWRFRIEIPHLRGNAVEGVLFLIYNGRFDETLESIDVDDDDDLLQVCQQLGVDWLKEEDCRVTATTAADLKEDNVTENSRWVINEEVSPENLFHAIAKEEDRCASSGAKMPKRDDEAADADNESSQFLFDDDRLERNGRDRDDVKPFACDICGKCFEGESRLRSHAEIHITKILERPYACDSCGKMFRERGRLKKHCRLHVSALRNVHTCALCDRVFFKEYYLRKHLRRHANLNNRYVCDACDKNFVLVSDLRKHRATHEDEGGIVKNGVTVTDVEGIKVEKKPFSCNMCSRLFASPEFLRRHHRTSCLDCQKCFADKRELERHREEEPWSHRRRRSERCYVPTPLIDATTELDRATLQRYDEKPYACSACGKTYKKRNSLVRHAATHERSEACYVCFVCSESFHARRPLQRHIRRHADDSTYVCELCGKSFRDSHTLKKHALVHSSDAPFVCATCGRAFRQEYYLKKHLRRHTDVFDYSCEYCGKAFKENYQLKKHCRIHTCIARHRCPKCSRSFRDESLLQRHSFVHDESVALPCDGCAKTFKVRAALNVHRKIHTTTTTKKTFECASCPAVCASVRDLRRHEAAVHPLLPATVLATHQCCECGKLFTHANHLKNHTKVHTDAKTHACAICQRTFRRQADMRSHVLTHYGEKNNLCSICGKGFLKKSDLKRHFQGHMNERPYVCDTCGKGFKILSYLKEHLYTHATHKAFSCPDCKKAFSSVGNLKNHLKIHSGLKPHKCPVCPKEFLRPANMRSHLTVHVKRSELFADQTCGDHLDSLGDLDKYALLDLPSPI